LSPYRVGLRGRRRLGLRPECRNAVRKFERGGSQKATTVEAIQRALENAGVIFIARTTVDPARGYRHSNVALQIPSSPGSTVERRIEDSHETHRTEPY
jgi:hypothetical protein